MKKKYCPRCKKKRLRSKFGIDISRRDGMTVYCKVCGSIRRRERYHKNPETAKIYRDTWREENPERYKEINAEYYSNNKKYFKEFNKEYYKTHKDEFQKRQQTDGYKTCQARYYQLNKKKILAHHRKRYLELKRLGE